MIRRIPVILLALLLACAVAAADSVTAMRYVFQDWAGEYTGEVDEEGRPLGYGLFVSSTPRDSELWHYIGAWRNGLPEGEGAVYFENGGMLKGTFSGGELIDGMQYSVSAMAAEVVRPVRSLPAEDGYQYIGNKKSKRFHLPDCPGVETMSDKNKVFFYSREEAIDAEYIPCGTCNP